jgi:hypothetical protein
MAEAVDIQQVINRSTSKVSLTDLTRKGVKQVRVLNHAAIARLITEAVDEAIAARKNQITASEREKVVAESRRIFEELARSRIERERSRIEELEILTRSLTDEAAQLRMRLQAAVELKAERDQALEQVRQLESESERLRSAFLRLEEESARLRARLEAEEGTGAERSAAQVESLHSLLVEKDKEISKLEGKLAAKGEILERLAAAGGALSQDLVAGINEKLERLSRPEEVREIKECLAGLQKNIATLATGSVALRKGEALDTETMVKFAEKQADVSMETNVSKVKLKQARAAGIGESLARLKKLQKGAVEDGK